MKGSIRGRGIALIAMLAIPMSLAAYDNSPINWLVLPEVIWAKAVGPGDWQTEVQVMDFSGSSQIRVMFFYGGSLYRGPYLLQTGALYHAYKYSNILEYIQTNFDAAFSYYGKVGALWFYTQDTSHKIQVTARTFNGDYSKTFQGLNAVESNTANLARYMVVMNLVQNTTYRSTVGFHNPTNASVYVHFVLIDDQNVQIGSDFYKTFAPYDFQAFYPFTEAGVGSGTYDNVWLYIEPKSGSGSICGFGATANNTTNDPAAHVAVQFQ